MWEDTLDMNETNVPRFDAALVKYEAQSEEEATTSASDMGLGYLKVSRYVSADRMSGSKNEQAVPIPAEVLFQILFRFAFPNDSDYYLTRYENFLSLRGFIEAYRVTSVRSLPGLLVKRCPNVPALHVRHHSPAPSLTYPKSQSYAKMAAPFVTTG